MEGSGRLEQRARGGGGARDMTGSSAVDDGLARYTQEILNGELAGRASNGMDSIVLEDGPQTFEKESEDCIDVRQ